MVLSVQFLCRFFIVYSFDVENQYLWTTYLIRVHIINLKEINVH